MHDIGRLKAADGLINSGCQVGLQSDPAFLTKRLKHFNKSAHFSRSADRQAVIAHSGRKFPTDKHMSRGHSVFVRLMIALDLMKDEVGLRRQILQSQFIECVCDNFS